MDPEPEPPERPLINAVESALDTHDSYLGPQIIVALAIALDVSLPHKLTIGPTWLLPAFEGLLLLGLVLATPHPRWRHSPVRRSVALLLIALVSLVNMFSLVLLCHYLIDGAHERGRPLILAGTVLWVTNVLLFGIWYWQLDRGGPIARHSQLEAPPDFLFPQMTEPTLASGWMPNLIDYLYVSFTNATAFSPTDAMPLSRTAKVLMAAQALTALVTVGLVVARAVNIIS